MINATSGEELLALGEIVDVRFLEFSAALRDEEREDLESDDVEQSLNVMVGIGESRIEVRLEIKLQTRTATYSGTAATQFKFDDELEVTEEIARDFAERAGIMAIYPYLRELIQSSSLRLRESVTLPLLRVGQRPLEDVVD